MGPDSSQGFNGGQKSPLSPTKDSVREKSDGILQDLMERRRTTREKKAKDKIPNGLK